MSRRLLSAGAVVALAAVLLTAALRADDAHDKQIEARLRTDITYLASDECEGRGVDTGGINKAAEYVAGQFAKAGLKPGGPGGDWFQPFPFSVGAQQDGTSTLTLRGPQGQTITLRSGTDFTVLGLSGAGKAAGPLVFAGHGITAKEIGYDDYKGLDVAGKIVVVIRRTPRYASKELPFDGARRDQHASLDNKQAVATLNKAAAVLLVNDSSELNPKTGGDRLMPFQTTARAVAGSSLPYFHVKRSVFDAIFRTSLGQDIGDLERAINRDLKPRSAPLVGWSAALEAKVKRRTVTVKNVLGVLEGSGPHANETVVIGAHYDHLGYGGRGSRTKNPKKKEIHHGADDNASGTTTLIELARRFGAQKNRKGRRLVFIAFTAEESGLIGSRHYTKRAPLFPLKDTVAMVNLDMVGRLRPDPKTGKDKLLVEGVGTAKGFEPMLEKLNTPGFQLVKKKGGNGPSDHDSFYNARIPVVFFWTGLHEDYHRPSDTADKINVAGMRRIAEYAQQVIGTLATQEQRPEYVQVASSFTPTTGSKTPRLGIMPDYEEEKAGVLVGGVAKGGPAEKGGLKAGDLIVEIAGRGTPNINVYMAVMGQQRPGSPLDVTVLRGGKKLKLKVTPQ